MSDTPMTDEKFNTLMLVAGKGVSFLSMTNFARTLERKLNATNKIIADAKEYIAEWTDSFPEDGLLKVLNGMRLKPDNDKDGGLR